MKKISRSLSHISWLSDFFMLSFSLLPFFLFQFIQIIMRDNITQQHNLTILNLVCLFNGWLCKNKDGEKLVHFQMRTKNPIFFIINFLNLNLPFIIINTSSTLLKSMQPRKVRELEWSIIRFIFNKFVKVFCYSKRLLIFCVLRKFKHAFLLLRERIKGGWNHKCFYCR